MARRRNSRRCSLRAPPPDRVNRDRLPPDVGGAWWLRPERTDRRSPCWFRQNERKSQSRQPCPQWSQAAPGSRSFCQEAQTADAVPPASALQKRLVPRREKRLHANLLPAFFLIRALGATVEDEEGCTP